MKIQNVMLFIVLGLLLSACESETSAVTDSGLVKKEMQPIEKTIKEVPVETAKLSKRDQIDAEIRRIEEKLKTNPTVKGWILVGDAHMHLKRYKEAAGAYNDAYMLSGQAPEPRKKLKNAMYYVGLEKANAI
jgi:cytochrome c-type biogenesis protein CcmH/NrfG